MVITKQKPTLIQKNKEKGIETYLYRKSSNHKRRQQERKKRIGSYKTAREQLGGHYSLPVNLLLSVSDLNFPVKRSRVAGWIKTKQKTQTQLCAFHKRLTSGLRTHTN